VNKCPRPTTEIKEEICNYLDRRKFKAIEQHIDEEDAAEVERCRSIIYIR
jgi:hypothetical protein